MEESFDIRIHQFRVDYGKFITYFPRRNVNELIIRFVPSIDLLNFLSESLAIPSHMNGYFGFSSLFLCFPPSVSSVCGTPLNVLAGEELNLTSSNWKVEVLRGEVDI